MADLAPADWPEDHEPAAPADRGPADRWGRAVLRPQHFEVLVSSQSSCDSNDRRWIPFQPCSHPGLVSWVRPARMLANEHIPSALDQRTRCPQMRAVAIAQWVIGRAP